MMKSLQSITMLISLMIMMETAQLCAVGCCHDITHWHWLCCLKTNDNNTTTSYFWQLHRMWAQMAASGSTFLLLNACHAALQLTAVRVAATFWCISCKSVSQRTLSRPSAILTDMTATSLPSVIDMCISIWRMHVHADRCPQVYRRRPDSCRLRIWHKGPNNKATQTQYPRHTPRTQKHTHFQTSNHQPQTPCCGPQTPKC